MNYPDLFSEILVGRKTLRNRITFPATAGNYAQQHAVSAQMIDYYEARAQGGAAMIVTEGLMVHESSMPPPTIVTLYDRQHLDGLQRLAAAVETHGCRLIGQLWHVGRQQLWNSVASPVGVSDQPDAFSGIVPHVLSVSEIRQLVDSYATSARLLQQAGFSGVELHGAHGYLITQFLSPSTNTRDDDYGGDLERRTRFVRELMAAVRAACGDDFILGLKAPGTDGVAAGIDPDEAERIFERVRSCGQLDYVAFSQGTFGRSLEDHTPDMHYPPGPFLDIHLRMRKVAAGLPVMAVGRITSAAHAQQVVASGTADLVAMSRALLSDAALPIKAREGRTRDIRPCIFCNVCWGEVHAMKPMACIHNPQLAQPKEVQWAPKAAKASRLVVVVGAGVAGLEAAWVAAARGHQVTVVGQSESIGGKARLEASLPGRQELAQVYEYQLRQAHRHGVKFRLGQRADAQVIASMNPDAVVLATGSRLRPLGTLEAQSEPGIDLRAWIQGKVLGTSGGGSVVLFDDDQTSATYAAVEQLAQRFSQVTLLTSRMQLARMVPHVSALGVYRRLYALRVDIVLSVVPQQYANRELSMRHVFTGDIATLHNVDHFIYVTPRAANDELAPALAAIGIQTHLVGDCRSPRTLMAAIHEGQRIANEL